MLDALLILAATGSIIDLGLLGAWLFYRVRAERRADQRVVALADDPYARKSVIDSLFEGT